MAIGLILKFDGVGKTEYDAVNAQLNINQYANSGDWPPGLLLHEAGMGDGHMYVVETWESRDAQGKFMAERLGRALAAGGITGQPQVTWIDPLFSFNTPGK